ncbi:ABC transporter ATP-binding protein [Christensenellaceae bacterium OttesenSCG-928-L17]|nr:ABC transporter ATP-binding protein [Christensenellaceae bacterium OttesenSCG-928-L17]
MAGDAYIVDMRNITKRFPGIVANDNVSIQIKKGEIFAILGENGAGKSTLMSMLFGMYEPDEGEIYIRGKKERIASPSAAVSLDIGMVHQHFKLVENFTVTENIVLGIEPIKRKAGVLPYVDIKGTNEKIRALSRQYGLDVDPTALIEDLKVSARQRVEILKMLYREAEILIFDEPTAMLTPQEIDFLLEIIRNLRDGGKTIVLITHKLEEIKRVADRCAVLNHGKLVGMLDVATTTTKEMANKMVGRDVAFEIEKPAPAFGDVVLQVENLTVENNNKFEVVRNVSFAVRAGEIFAIAGVAGNGQVEIADAIAGLAKAKSGTISLNGKEITNLPVRERTVEGISYIPEDRQTYGLILDFTLSENTGMRKYYTSPFSKGAMLQMEAFDDYAQKLIDAYDIRTGSGVRTPTRSMSGGNQQKAIVAREVEQNTPFMIFVQPTRGLDIGAITSIREKMIAERNRGKAILLISLELDEIMTCADTIGVIYNGELLKIADVGTIDVNEVGEYMMGVKTS